MANKLSTEEFIEPLCERQEGEHEDVVEVRLPGFKKEQLRAQINNLGVLTISGERSADKNKRIHFRKEINVSKYCKRDEIHAKFSGGSLRLIMPKRVPSVIPRTPPVQADQQIEENGKPKENVDKDKLPAAVAAAGTAATSSMLRKATKCISGLKYAVPRRQISRKTAIKLGALAAVVVAAAVGAYVAYKYRHGFHVED